MIPPASADISYDLTHSVGDKCFPTMTFNQDSTIDESVHANIQLVDALNACSIWVIDLESSTAPQSSRRGKVTVFNGATIVLDGMRRTAIVVSDLMTRALTYAFIDFFFIFCGLYQAIIS